MQHPSLYSPETLEDAKHLLRDFLNGTTPSEMRKMMRDRVNSLNRRWKIRGTTDSYGVYEHAVQWMMTAHDVVLAGTSKYIESIGTWAQSIYKSLETSGNL